MKGRLVHVDAVSACRCSPVGERYSEPFQEWWVRVTVIRVVKPAKPNQEARGVHDQGEDPDALLVAPAELYSDGKLESQLVRRWVHGLLPGTPGPRRFRILLGFQRSGGRRWEELITLVCHARLRHGA